MFTLYRVLRTVHVDEVCARKKGDSKNEQSTRIHPLSNARIRESAVKKKEPGQQKGCKRTGRYTEWEIEKGARGRRMRAC